LKIHWKVYESIEDALKSLEEYRRYTDRFRGGKKIHWKV